MFFITLFMRCDSPGDHTATATDHLYLLPLAQRAPLDFGTAPRTQLKSYNFLFSQYL